MALVLWQKPAEQFTDTRDSKATSASTSGNSLHQSSETDDLDLRCENTRLKTLRDHWGGSVEVMPRAARNGLYFSQKNRALCCFSCNVILDNLKNDDDPEIAHGTRSSDCKFLLNEPVGNIPIIEDPVRRLPGQRSAKHPAFMMKSARLATFKFWPVRMRQKPDELVDAGFYYSGVGDQTLCYYCGIGLKNWEDDDTPWIEHALWSKDCPYLLAMKGEDFVKKVQAGEKPGVIQLPEPMEADTEPEMAEITGEDGSCKICYSAKCNIVFVPCGHVVSCEKCATSLMNCPVCRKPREKLMKLYFS